MYFGGLSAVEEMPMGTEVRSSGLCRLLFHCTYLAVAALGLMVIPAAAGPGSEVWDELRASRPETTGVPVAGVVLVRDAFTFRLDSGAFFPLSKVSGRVVGGIFKGKGRFEIRPATESERVFLALRSRQKGLRILADTFEKAVFLFTDGTDKELLKEVGSARIDADKLLSSYDNMLKKSEKHLRADLRLRLAPDLVEARSVSGGLFLVAFEGERLPLAVAIFSPDGLDRLWLDTAHGPETTALFAFEASSPYVLPVPWYSERPVANVTAASAPAVASATAKALHYSIETTIRKNTDIEGRTTLRLRVGRDGVRVIPLDIFSGLRLSSVRLKREVGAALDVFFIQNGEGSTDPVLAVLPKPLASREEVDLELEYRGDGVLQNAYGGNFYVSARGNWYPVLNAFQDWAGYDLTYRIPKKLRIVSVGQLLESRDDGEFAVYHFTTASPVRGAAFNFGDFSSFEQNDPDSGMRIRVYSSAGVPYDLWYNRPAGWSGSRGIFHNDSLAMARDVLADSINTARVGTAYFGPLVQTDIAVTEQPQTYFGQSWSTLIFIPSIAFTEPLRRVEAGLNLPANESFIKDVVPREFAHQWWGNSVGSATYRDAWLEDGLAEFTAGLVLEKSLGAVGFRDFWRQARKDILGIDWHPSRPIWKAGPILLGRRLASPENPSAYRAIVRLKGAFVIQMLRTLFWDEKSENPEQRFIEMMKDFAATWAGRNPATDDFRIIAERHAPPAFAGNLGWFFQQWIKGTAIPKVRLAIRFKETGKGHYRLIGKISQSEVPDDFRSVLPVCVRLGRDRIELVDRVTITGNRVFSYDVEIALPQRPLKILINPSYEWLTR